MATTAAHLTSRDKHRNWWISGYSFFFFFFLLYNYGPWLSPMTILCFQLSRFLSWALCNLFCKYWVLKRSALVLEMQLLHANIFIVINNRHALISAPAAASDIDLNQAEGIANEVSWITLRTRFVLKPVLLYMHEINSLSKPRYHSF